MIAIISLFLWVFGLAGKEVFAGYTSEVVVPAGMVSVGTLTPETFLALIDNGDRIRIEERLMNPGFEQGMLGFLGSGESVFKYDLTHEGVVVDTVFPDEGVEMALLNSAPFGDESSLGFWLTERTANVTMRVNMITSSSKLVSESRLEVRVNGVARVVYDLSKANPGSESDGVPRQSDFFELSLNLLDSNVPILVQIVNVKDPLILLPDLSVLIDKIDTKTVRGNTNSVFEIWQTGRFLPHKYYRVNGSFVEGSTFSLGNGRQEMMYFAEDDYGNRSATKSATLDIYSATISAVVDLTKTETSTTASRLQFSYLRDRPLLAKIYGASSCDAVASGSAIYHPLRLNGLWEDTLIPGANCFALRVTDEYRNISDWSNLSQ